MVGFTLLTSLQVVLAVIPGEILEIIAGLLYGPIVGCLIILVGISIGVIIVYYLVKLVGRNFINKFLDTKYYEGKLSILNSTKRIEILIFFISLVPGLPKDLIAFVVPLTKVKLKRFLVINAVARIPSILSSTIIGYAFFDGKFTLGFVILIVQGIIAVIGIVFNKQISLFIENKLDKSNV